MALDLDGISDGQNAWLRARLRTDYPYLAFLDVPNAHGRDHVAAFGGTSEIRKTTISAGDHPFAVAVKRLNVSPNGFDGDNQEVYRRLIRELSIWTRLHHPNVVSLLGICFDRNPDGPAFVMPWMMNGTLGGYIHSHPRFRLNHVLSGVSNGVAYIHSLDIVHGDLKMNNILVDADHRPLISDFGLSCDASDESSFVDEGVWVGNPRWSAPEWMDPRKYGLSYKEASSKASDMYALGMTIYEMSSSKLPFSELGNIYHVVDAVMSGQRPPFPEEIGVKRGLNANLWHFVQRCWREDRSARPRITELLQLLQSDTELAPESSAQRALPGSPQYDPKDTAQETNAVSSSEESRGPFSLLMSVLSRMLGESPQQVQRNAGLELLARHVAKSKSDVDQWVLNCPSPAIRAAGMERQETLAKTLESITLAQLYGFFPTRWSPYPEQDFERGEEQLLQSMHEFYRTILHELVLSDQVAQLQILKQGAALLPLREAVAKSEERDRQRVFDVVQHWIRLLRTNEVADELLPASVYVGLESMVPIDAVPLGVQDFEGLRDLSSRTTSRRFHVCIGEWKGEAVAVKWFRNPRLMEEEGRTRFIQETSRWRLLGHPNVLPFYGVHIARYLDTEMLGTVAPWASGGNVMQLINAVPDTERRSLICGAARGLAYLHRREVVHGNIRGVNILLDAYGRAMVADFRLPFAFSEDPEALVDGRLRAEPPETIRWLAPELTIDKQLPTYASDVFSFGRLILEIMTGEIPFKSQGNLRELARLLNQGTLHPERPDDPQVKRRGLTDAVWELLADMWDNNPVYRPTMQMVESKLDELG